MFRDPLPSHPLTERTRPEKSRSFVNLKATHEQSLSSFTKKEDGKLRKESSKIKILNPNSNHLSKNGWVKEGRSREDRKSEGVSRKGSGGVQSARGPKSQYSHYLTNKQSVASNNSLLSKNSLQVQNPKSKKRSSKN